MRPITPERPRPTGERYWTVETRHGPRTFRHPYYGQAAAILAALQGMRTPAPPEGDHAAQQAYFIGQIPSAGLLIGACWADPAWALETPLPADLTPEALAAFGIAVANELQDADLNLLDIAGLFSGCLPPFTMRQNIYTMAAAQADFSPAPTERSTSA